MKNGFVRKFIMMLISILVLVYIGSQIYRSNFSSIDTEVANTITASDSLTRTGYFIRDEELIINQANEYDILSYQIEDGEHINSGGVLIKTYENANDVVTEKRVENINSELLKLNELLRLSDSFFASVDSVDKNISQEIQNMILNVKSEDYSKINNNKENLLYLISEKQIVTGKNPDFSFRISELQNEKKGLLNSFSNSTSSIVSNSAGYFSSSTDGYEGIFTTKDIKNILPDDLNFDKITPKNIESNVVGKVMTGLEWYVAFNISAEEALEIKSLDTGITLSISAIGLYDIPAEIYSINQETKTSDAVLIVKSSYMNDIIINARMETVKINFKTYTGIKVSKKAIHNENILCLEIDNNGNYVQKIKNVPGVYVLYKNQLVFKQILPIYTDENFVICEADAKKIEKAGILTKNTVTLYDKIVIGGTDLYDGKVIKS